MNGSEAMKVSMDNNGGWRGGGFTIREPVGMPGVVTRFEYLALARDRERAAAKESAPIKDKPIYLPRVSGRQWKMPAKRPTRAPCSVAWRNLKWKGTSVEAHS